MNKSLPMVALGFLLTFMAGFGTHLLYKRWSVPGGELASAEIMRAVNPPVGFEPQNHVVKFIPPGAAGSPRAELPILHARDLEKIRGLIGDQARIRGRVFRVGHSAKSNTYFLDFGPSREALTAVIFASAVESFKLRKLPPKEFEGKEIEIQGVVKDHPQYGLEVILEDPAQVRIVN
jgi:hypothetical protein